MECKFCTFVENGVKEEIIRLKHTIAFLDKNQFYRGKTIVMLSKHLEDLNDLSESDRIEFFSEMIKISNAIKFVLKPDKLNYALLGNAVPHLHWHIIPRYKNDSNWGKAPWPHGEITLSDEENQNLIQKIRTVLV